MVPGIVDAVGRQNFTFWLRNVKKYTFDSLASFVKHCGLRVYSHLYLSASIRYLIQQLSNLALLVPTQCFKFGNVIWNNKNKRRNRVWKSSLKSSVILTGITIFCWCFITHVQTFLSLLRSKKEVIGNFPCFCNLGQLYPDI